MQHVNEDVAEQFRDAYPNAKLLSIAPVALPLYLVTADVLVGAKRNIPSITEFILRSERAGLTSELDVAGFLGLNQRFVTRTTVELSDNGFIGRNASGQIHSTDRGTALLREMSQWTPEDQTIAFAFDAVLRRSMVLRGADLASPRDIDDSATIVVRGLPDARPSRHEVRLGDMYRIIKDQNSQFADGEYEVLAIKRIARATRRYRLATGLLFKSRTSTDLNLVLVSQGERLVEVERRLVESGALARQSLLVSHPDSSLERRLKDFAGQIVGNLQSIEDVEALQKKVAGARFGLTLAIGKYEASPSSETQARGLAANAALEAALSDLRKFRVRPMAPYEQSQLLWRGVSEAKSELVIGTSTFHDNIVTTSLIDAMTELLAHNVIIHILVSDLRRVARAAKEGPSAALSIEALARRSNGNLRILETPRREFHFLSWDRTCAALVNAPFLAFRDSERAFRPFAGLVLQQANLVESASKSFLSEGRAVDQWRRN